MTLHTLYISMPVHSNCVMSIVCTVLVLTVSIRCTLFLTAFFLSASNSTSSADFLKTCDDCLLMHYSSRRGDGKTGTYLLFYSKKHSISLSLFLSNSLIIQHVAQGYSNTHFKGPPVTFSRQRFVY